MLAAGVDLALVSKRLGHSSVAITSDKYSHLLEGVDRRAANAASALIPAALAETAVPSSADTANKRGSIRSSKQSFRR